MDRPDPSKYPIEYDKIIKAGTKDNKQSPRKALWYLKINGYPTEYLDEVLMIVKRTRNESNEYYRATPKTIADIVFGFGHPALEKNPKGVYQGQVKKPAPKPVVKRKPLRTGIEWLNIRKEIEKAFKFNFKPENYDYKYKSLDEFVSFASDEELNEYRSN